MEKIILIFLDGVGIGEEDPRRNPLLPLFSDMAPGLTLSRESFGAGSGRVRAAALDACLGVPGIPQSATGQSSLYTGVNAQALLGYHLNALPNEPLIRLLRERSLPAVLKRVGARPLNANLHTPAFFRARRGGRKNRFPVSTIMTFAAREPFLFERDYREGRGIFMDISGELLRERGLPTLRPEEAALRLCDLTDRADFVYFEYFLTDRWGHKRNREAMAACLADLVPFLGALAESAPARGIHLMVVSDHGNGEDFHTGDHTRNRVPFLLCSPPEGPRPERLPRKLTGVYDLIMSLYNGKSSPL